MHFTVIFVQFLQTNFMETGFYYNFVLITFVMKLMQSNKTKLKNIDAVFVYVYVAACKYQRH